MLVKCPQCKGKVEYDYQDNIGVIYPVDCMICNKTSKVEKCYTANRKRKVKVK